MDHLFLNVKDGLVAEINGEAAFFYHGCVLRENEYVLIYLFDPKYVVDYEIVLHMLGGAVEDVFSKNPVVHHIYISPTYPGNKIHVKCILDLGFKRNSDPKDRSENGNTFVCGRYDFLWGIE